MNVAITGVGGGVGQSILKSLQDTEYNVVAIDADELAVGLYAAKRSYVGLYADDRHYIDRIIEICTDARCTVLFPGLDAELAPLSRHRERLAAHGICPIVSEPNVINSCNDKLLTARFLESHKLPHPHTFDVQEYSFELDFPVVLKPKKGGARSTGVFLAHNRKQFEMVSASLDASNYIVQEHIEGDEYTCGTVTLADRCVGVIIMKRQLRAGDTYKAFVVKDHALETFVRRVVTVLKPFGACNVQLRVREGTPYVFEINARCSGTTAARTLAGFNEPKMICDFIGKGVDNPPLSIRDIVILRYWNELVTDTEAIQTLRTTHCINGPGVKL